MQSFSGSPFDLRPRRERHTLTFDWVFPLPQVAGLPMLPLLRAWMDLPDAGWTEFALALDTGADLSLVDGAMAAIRGFDPTRYPDRVAPLRGVTGVSLAYVHRLTCSLLRPDLAEALDVLFHLPVAFTAPDASSPPFNVLGRAGVLDTFVIALDIAPVFSRLLLRRFTDAPKPSR